MNETLLLILTWLPVVAESGLLVFAAKFLAKKIKDHFSIPEKQLQEAKQLKSEMRQLNSYNAKLAEDNQKLQTQIHNLTMQLKGFINYGEDVKKN